MEKSNMTTQFIAAVSKINSPGDIIISGVDTIWRDGRDDMYVIEYLVNDFPVRSEFSIEALFDGLSVDTHLSDLLTPTREEALQHLSDWNEYCNDCDKGCAALLEIQAKNAFPGHDFYFEIEEN